MVEGSPWRLSHRADPASRVIADRHYNRQKAGSPQFVPPGRCVVLRTEDNGALWVTSWPFPEYVRHAWPGAWINSLFRREYGERASDLIRLAVAHTRSIWEPPAEGLITFVDASKVKPKRDPGYCYTAAGFRQVGTTKGGLRAFHLAPADMPDALPVPIDQLCLDLTAEPTIEEAE